MTQLNKKRKRTHYQSRINDAKADSGKIWNVLNELMGEKTKSTPAFVEADGKFLAQSKDIADYLSNYFDKKIQNLRNGMDLGYDSGLSYRLIKDKIMKNKSCTFNFVSMTVDHVVSLLRNTKVKPPGVDNLDVKLLIPVADLIAIPIAHIINLSLDKCIFPTEWKTAKIVPLPKNGREPFSGKNSRPISLLPALSKIMERIVFEQIKNYFGVNELNTIYQHADKEGHSTTTALTQMTDD